MEYVVPLDPAQLTPSASLNRLRLVDLPDVELETDVRGKLFYDLLSVEALIGLFREARDLMLSDDELARPADLPLVLERKLGSRDRAVRSAAEEIGATLGRRLAYLILTLKRGDDVNRQARQDWDDSYWDHWSAVRRIWFGGGLMSGNLGRLMVQQASAMLRQEAVDCSLYQAEHAAILPLLGAARGVPPGYEAAVVFDFGGTWVKSALAMYERNTLVALGLRAPQSSATCAALSLSQRDKAERLGEHMISILLGAWQEIAESGLTLAPVFVAGMASYIRDNQPLERQGGVYTDLLILSNNLGDWLADRLSICLGLPVTVELLHDGTAAAQAFAGESHSAVIMLGTALGVGFPRHGDDLLPVADKLQVV